MTEIAVTCICGPDAYVNRSERGPQHLRQCPLHDDAAVTCGGCLIGFPRGTGMHSFGNGCRIRLGPGIRLEAK